ncbi:substrate-binding domain-containing protein [Paenibacillus glycanilyticus]|uniref:substrate-binding domain-containing protein n=1 Tax=Paenibacillus glycanilyticus TaxID=126569 RepID=UPI00203EF92A|nr:substrate-binding domain-containing protein [Paenibacillus glycanilyticus]MCM3628740.1 substrate-binding domain-containing protein [Paenibacillus glycanilyticus]
MPRPKKISMQTIADKLGISRNAVSLALSNKKGIGEELRQRVIQTAQEVGYLTEAGQSSVSAPILVLVPDRVMSHEDNEHFLFYHDLIWGLDRRLQEEGYSAVIVRISMAQEQDQILPELALHIDYQGIIAFGILERDYIAKVQQVLPKPMLLFDSYYREIESSAVTSANVEGACAAVNSLIEAGHQRIGCIAPVNLTTSHEERWFGYTKAMLQHKLQPDFSLCLLESEGFVRTQEELSSYCDRFGEGGYPTAVFCGNDRIALLLMKELEKRGLQVPRDVSVIGFDGLAMSAEANPPLTTMAVNKKALCTAAVEVLGHMLRQPDGPAVRCSAAPVLRMGGSVRHLS